MVTIKKKKLALIVGSVAHLDGRCASPFAPPAENTSLSRISRRHSPAPKKNVRSKGLASFIFDFAAAVLCSSVLCFFCCLSWDVVVEFSFCLLTRGEQSRWPYRPLTSQERWNKPKKHLDLDTPLQERKLLIPKKKLKPPKLQKTSFCYPLPAP